MYFFLFLTGENGFEVETGGSTLTARALGRMDEADGRRGAEGGGVEEQAGFERLPDGVAFERDL